MFLHAVRPVTLIISALAIVFLSSCDSLNERLEEPVSCKGKVTLSLAPDIEIKSLQSQSEVDDYYFRFAGLDGYATSEKFRYGDVSWPMDWYYGIFRMEAESCSEEVAEAGYGCLRYAGVSEVFSVVNGQTASVWVLCQVANAKVSVYFDNSMFESFDAFRLDVDEVTYPEEEESEEESSQASSEEILLRSLSFDSVDKSGYYNLYETPVYLRYTLFIRVDGAEEYVPVKTGFLDDEQTGEPVALNAGDDVTFNVRYTGDPVISPNIKFIISGQRVSVENGLKVQDYVSGSVMEDE